MWNNCGTKINGLLTANLLANSRTHGVQGLADWKLLAALRCIVGENEAVTSSFLLYILFPRLTNSRPTIGNLASNGTKDQMVTLTFHCQLAIFSSTTSLHNISLISSPGHWIIVARFVSIAILIRWGGRGGGGGGIKSEHVAWIACGLGSATWQLGEHDGLDQLPTRPNTTGPSSTRNTSSSLYLTTKVGPEYTEIMFLQIIARICLRFGLLDLICISCPASYTMDTK